MSQVNVQTTIHQLIVFIIHLVTQNNTHFKFDIMDIHILIFLIILTVSTKHLQAKQVRWWNYCYHDIVHIMNISKLDFDVFQILWIGNSYTYVNDVPQTVQKLRIANGQPHEINYEEHLKGGWTWEMHANSEVCIWPFRYFL